MEKLLDKKVKVETNNVVMIGKLYDYTQDEKTVWIETEEDIFAISNFGHLEEIEEETKEEVEEEAEEETEEENPIYQALAKENIQCDSFNNGDYGDDILITGSTYDINIWAKPDGTYECCTIHKERWKQEDKELYGDTTKAYANHRDIKNVKTVIRYIKRWIEA
ncbi:hypothetical protein NYE37_03995 [Thermoactinomyces sp. FSL K6-2592]|uniref:hypothetical protein n=1 Tax=Thermoactinomyces sp. FSL K6-2592 TaxID=2975347 RepID=UPI0030F72692